ncbi:hypothetical protein [Shinella sp.]|uniref:hypothetical protein n=1 Tax=Shinella sp. TaxID=1870904 RepID=UPI00289F0307|nr:hypothetical protein [Shinella sp.]
MTAKIERIARESGDMMMEVEAEVRRIMLAGGQMSDLDHLRPKRGEPEMVIRDVRMAEGHYRNICLLPEGVETVCLGTFDNGAALPDIQLGSAG